MHRLLLLNRQISSVRYETKPKIFSAFQLVIIRTEIACKLIVFIGIQCVLQFILHFLHILICTLDEYSLIRS